MFYTNERLALYIDGADLQLASQRLDFRIDFKKLQAVFADRGKLTAISNYVAVGDRSEYAGVHQLLDWQRYNGFRVFTKPMKEYTNRDGQSKRKGNVLVEMTVAALEHVHRLDHIVLFASSEELVPLVHALQRRGVRVSVVSTRKSDPPLVSNELRGAADNFIELEKLIEIIGQ